MGGDGGTIISRRDCLRFNKGRKGKDVSRDMERMTKWLHCALSQEPLSRPVVGCRLGRLYNKDRLIEFLLNKHRHHSSSTGAGGSLSNMSHIRSLKDVKDVTLCERNVGTSGAASAEVKDDTTTTPHSFPFCCPIMGMEMNGVYKFALLWNCGCVLAERAIRQLHLSLCPNCNTAFKSEDVVIVHAEGEDLELMQSRLDAKMALEEEKREAKKRKSLSHSDSSSEVELKKKKLLTAEKSKTDVETKLNTAEMKESDSFRSLFHTNKSRNKLDPNRGFWSETTHSYFFKGT